MAKLLTASEIRGRRIVGLFRARLHGDPEGYNGEDGDYFRVFVELEDGEFVEIFDDASHSPLALCSSENVASLNFRPIEQRAAQECIGDVIEDVFTTAQHVTVLQLASNRLLWITADYETLVCLCDKQELVRDCPYLVERLVPYFG